MARTTARTGFAIEPARSKPVAVINPSEISRVVGAVIRLDGRASSSSDGSELTYAWSFSETPLGSTTTEFTDVEGDGSVVTFVPDVTGQYTVQLVVSTPYRSSDAVEATVEATSVLLPLSLRTTPNGKALFNVVSSFWKMVDRNAVFSTVWSGYMQGVGSDMLRAFQVDYGKSISTVQEMFQRRWIAYPPALELDSSLCTGVFGYHQGGVAAFTPSGSIATLGAIVSDTEIVLVDGTASLSAVGMDLVVYTSDGDNTGTYTINRLNSDSSGYIVSASTPFPSPSADTIAAAETLATAAGSDEVYDTVLTADFAAAGVEAGDVLRIESGADAGYYVIEEIVSARRLRVDRAVTQTRSGRTYSIFNTVRVSAAKQASAATDTVYLPASEADLSSLTARTLSGSGTLTGLYEITVEPRHVFQAMVGERIYIRTGSTSTRSYTITGINEAGTGYVVGAAFSTSSSFPVDVAYSLTSNVDAADRLLILEGEAYQIVSAEYDAGTDPEDGGRGEVWVVVLAEATAPAGREGMSWRIAATLSTTEHEDFEELGVTAGDLLVLEVVRVDSDFVGEFPCYVLGARGNVLSFDFGTSEPPTTGPGSLSGDEILALATELKVPYVYEDESGEVLVTLSAEEVQALVSSSGFELTYGNVPISSSTEIDLDLFKVRLRVKKIVRNCRVPVDDTLVSVPSLFEYIASPSTGENDDGETILVTEYGEATTLARAPIELIENRDYSISSDTSLTGSNLVTEAGSSTLQIPGGDLIDRDVRVGDYIDIESGFDQGRYYIRAVLDTERVSALTAEGSPPGTAGTGLDFTLVRRTTGNFLRFVDGMFTPASPAPDRFWAQLSLFDNYETIEDNFGIAVGVTKEQLDEYGASQVSYRGAVRALMFAWTRGPTVRNVTVGNHVLMGLPVTEVPGRIIDLDEAYDASNGRGRVLVEDLDHDGNGTNLVRAYFFSSTEDGLDTFQGIATNPTTGEAYTVGDDVPQMVALSKGIVVDDYLTDATWWKSSAATGADELKKFHTWQVLVDAAQVDSRDMQLIVDFCSGIRPIYTKPKVVLVLYLEDEITIEDEVSLEGTLFLYDDPILSVEATHITDSYNGSSLPQRLLDIGSFATRTLFEGVDLSTEAGTGVVTSARGGFMGTLDATPLEHADDEAVGVLHGVNDYFTGDVYYRGTPLVRAGDVLYITGGANRGRYSIVSVDSDTQLTVEGLEDYPPTTRPAAEIEAGESQVFQIQRLDSHRVTSGTAAAALNEGAGDDATSTIEDVEGNFRWNGVAVGDVLVITSTGATIAPGTYEVLEIGTWLDGDRVDLDTRLVVRGTLTVGEAFEYWILRDALRENPLAEMGDLEIGGSTATSASGAFQVLYLRPGDQLEILSGTYAGQAFDILDATSATTLYIDATLGAETGVQARIVRPAAFSSDETRDEDWGLERLCLSDDVTATIVAPRSLVVTVPDLVLANDTTDPDPGNWFATATSATVDLSTAGVVVGAYLSVQVATAADPAVAELPPATPDASNSGTREVLGVAGGVATIRGLWRSGESPVAGEFYVDAADWSVVDATAELTTAATLEGLVVPGDVVEIDDVGSFVVASVSGAVLTLTRDTGVNPPASYTGRVYRRSVG